MTWMDFLKPTIEKVLLTILLVAILSYFFYLTIFIMYPFWHWVVGIIVLYLMSCLIAFAFEGLKKK
jgi:hypothetical protein